MFKLASLFALALAAPVSEYPNLFKVEAQAGEVIPGQYIVVYKTPATADSLVERVAGGEVLYEYDMPGFSASAVKVPESFDAADVQSYLVNDNVAYIEQDTVVVAVGSQVGGPYGLARISSRKNPGASGTYFYPDSAGRGVTAYVIDTGVLTSHPEFEGRAVFGFDATNSGPGDGNGHGISNF